MCTSGRILTCLQDTQKLYPLQFDLMESLAFMSKVDEIILILSADLRAGNALDLPGFTKQFAKKRGETKKQALFSICNKPLIFKGFSAF